MAGKFDTYFMMKKASEYSEMCDADVCVAIRMRETGQIHILSADTSGFWAFLTLQLVRNTNWHIHQNEH
jgi:hypothetical protein